MQSKKSLIPANQINPVVSTALTLTPLTHDISLTSQSSVRWHRDCFRVTGSWRLPHADNQSDSCWQNETWARLLTHTDTQGEVTQKTLGYCEIVLLRTNTCCDFSRHLYWLVISVSWTMSCFHSVRHLHWQSSELIRDGAWEAHPPAAQQVWGHQTGLRGQWWRLRGWGGAIPLVSPSSPGGL